MEWHFERARLGRIRPTAPRLEAIPAAHDNYNTEKEGVNCLQGKAAILKHGLIFEEL